MTNDRDQTIPTKNREIHALALGGEGVARPADREGGPVIFVPYTAAGDRVDLTITETRSGYARGWIQNLLTPSPDRTVPPCPYFYRPGLAPHEVCGGCDWQHINHARQVAAKHTLLVESFQRIARIPQPTVETPVTVDAPEGAWRYRNKVQIPFALDKNGHITGGFYAPGSHTVIPFEDCLIQSEKSVVVFRAVRDFFRKNPVDVFDPKSGTGWLKHLVVRTTATGQTLAVLVTQNGPVPPALIQELSRGPAAVTSFYQNINTRPGNTVVSGRWVHVAGEPHLEERLLGLRLRMSPGAFFQVHHAMAEKLYQIAIQMARPGPHDDVWELYAGVGAMGQLLARSAKSVVAIEENAHAVKDGIESARWNRIENIRFRTDRCERVVARLKEKPAVVVLDPPRAGCDKIVLKAVMARKPQRIVYVSCDPGTLARDARYLATGGYHLQRCVPVDLFPQTSHIESVSLFAKSPH